MTFTQLQARLYKSVQRDDFLVANDADVNYGTFINEAIREIENRKSWSTMKELAVVIIPAGDSSIELPADFKTLQNLRPPVHLVFNDPTTGEILQPVNVTWAEVEYRRLWVMGGMPWSVQTWLDRSDDVATLNIASQAGEDLTFHVRYYKYSPVLSGGSDTSALELRYPRMVMTKAKEIAFEAINDFESQQAAGAAFELLFLRASMQDNQSDVSGREGRM